MKYQMNFGVLGNVASPSAASERQVMRIAVLGDFSGRANKGELDTGDDLADHRPMKIDVDNIDDVIENLDIELQLPIGENNAVEFSLGSMDDFHPDELYDKLEIFEELSALRQQLENSSTFERAAKEVYSWSQDGVKQTRRPRKEKSRAANIPSAQGLDDFSKLMGRSAIREDAETNVEELMKMIVAPFVVAEENPEQEKLLAATDEALSEAMRSVLHHPDFQAMESIWRSIDLLTRRLETGTNLKIVLYDVTAEEFAADLSRSAELEETGLYKMLVEKPAMDAQQGTLSVIVGMYTFEQTVPHAELLGRIGKIASATNAAFLTSISPDVLKKQDEDEMDPAIVQSWRALKELREAANLGLVLPRFLLRQPYGKRSDSIDAFPFEEFTPHYGLNGMLWGNSAILAGLLLGETFSKQGLTSMKLGSIMSVGDMPYFVYNDLDGEQMALPCTERMMSVRSAENVVSQRFMPVISIRGTTEARLASFQSLLGCILAGPWQSDVPAAAEQPDSENVSIDVRAADDSPGDDGDSDDSEMDSELAALMADDSSSDDDDSDDSEMDPELAALLADL